MKKQMIDSVENVEKVEKPTESVPNFAESERGTVNFISYVIKNETDEPFKTFTRSDFAAAYKDEVDFLYDYKAENGCFPNVTTFLEKFENFPFLETHNPEPIILELKSDLAFRKKVLISESLSTELSAISDDGVTGVIEKLTKEFENFYNAFQNPNGDQFKGFLESFDHLKSAYNIMNEAAENLIADYSEDLSKYSMKNYASWLLKPFGDRITCGFDEIDKLLLGGGIEKDYSLTVFLAGTGIGKSWILCRIAKFLSEKGLSVIYFSPEMRREEIFRRIAAIILKKSYDQITVWDERFNIQADLEKFFEKFPAPTCIDQLDLQTMALPEIKRKIQQSGADVVLIDDLSYLEPEDQLCKNQAWQRIKQVCHELMNFSYKSKIPIYATSQANRSGNKDRSAPSLDQIADAFGISQKATMMLSLGQDQDGYTEIKVLKSRDSISDVLSKTFKYKVDFETCEYALFEVQDSVIVDENSGARIEVDEPKEPKRRGTSSTMSKFRHFENKQPLVRNNETKNETPF